MTPKRLLILPDFREEGWESMNLCAEMLDRELSAGVGAATGIAHRLFLPRFNTRASKLSNSALAINSDRLANRIIDYPRQVREARNDADVFHIVDHSYSQLIHELPADRTGVFCHDLDTFRSIIEPHRDPRGRIFRAMTRRILRGLQKAAVVFYSTSTVRAELEQHRLVDPARLVYAPVGVAPEFTAESEALIDLPPNLKRALENPCLLHVGSTIPRKRIDVLLKAFAEVRRSIGNAFLIKVGDEFSDEQRKMMRELDIEDAVITTGRLERDVVAELYRKCALVLQPSEAEGFGLPVAEALACGAIVLASDIPVLREVGGDAAIYLPVADVPAWTDKIVAMLNGAAAAPPLQIRLDRASRYSWARHAATIASAYKRLA